MIISIITHLYLKLTFSDLQIQEFITNFMYNDVQNTEFFENVYSTGRKFGSLNQVTTPSNTDSCTYPQFLFVGLELFLFPNL